MKKSLIWLFVIAMTVAMMTSFSLAGCKEEVTIEEETAAVEEAQEEAAEEEAIEKEPINLIFWDFGNYGVSAVQEGSPKEEWYIYKAIARFEEKNPGITVELTYQPGEKSIEMLTAAAMAKEGPDVISAWGGHYILGVKDSLLVLNDYFTPEEIAVVQGWENHAVGDKYYGTPIITSSTGIFYNKSIFEDAGIDPEKDYDGTYDGLVALCEKLKNAGITPMINGVADGWGLSFIEGSIFASQFASGADVEKVMNEIMAGERNFATTPEMVAAFKANQDLYTKEYYNDDCPTITWSESNTLFLNGEGAMKPDGTGMLYAFRKALGEDLGILSMPSLKADSPGFGITIGAIGTNCLAATNYGKHPIESVKFIKFMRTYEEEKEFLKDTGNLPCVKGDYSEAKDLFLENLNVTYIAPYLDNLMLPQVADTWWKLEAMMLSNQISVLEFLEEMDSARDEALAASE